MSSVTKEEFLELEKSLLSDANNGDIIAYKALGDLYYQGYSGNDKNNEKAYPYWKKAADAGDPTAAGLIGLRLYSGVYGENRKSEAIPYLIAAADAGSNGPGPQVILGMAYEHGMGCKENKALAEKYYQMAALQNDANAQYYLGRLQFLDKKANNDYLHWLCCAHINGNKEATEMLNIFIRNSDNQSEAKRVIEWEIEEIKKNGIVPKAKSNPSNSSDGCYIATAVYGSYNAPEVLELRRFRDEVLRSHWWGRVFIKAYYALSPSVADKLKDANGINSFVRNQLNRFVEYLHNKQGKKA